MFYWRDTTYIIDIQELNNIPENEACLELRNFCVQLHSIYRMRTKDRRKNENMTQWNDDVQNTINYYHNTLKELWKNKGRPIKDCDYEMDWSAYEQYKNKF